VTLAVTAAPTRRRVARKASPELVPFTLPHFRWWVADRKLTFDNGERVVLEAFQEAFLEDVFAGKAECWLVVPEGNGKTTLISLLALYHAEFRPSAAVPVAASSRDQAEVLYKQAEGFVVRSLRMQELLRSPIQVAKGKRKTDVPRFVCLEGYRRINHYTGSRIQIFAADERTGDGQIPTLGILDELHRHRDLALYRTWAGKLSKRGGQIVTISTAGEPRSDFELTRERIRKSAPHVIRRGFFTRAEAGRVVLHEYAVPAKVDVTDMAKVKLANPLRTITPVTLAEKFATPTMTLEYWLRFVCNRPTRDTNAAVQEAEWADAGVDEPIPAGEPIWLGLDYAPKWDTTALVPLWWKSHEWRQFGPAEILIPPRDGTVLEFTRIEEALIRIHERNPFHTVVMDMSRAEALAQWISDTFDVTVVDRSQTTSLAAEDFALFMEALAKGWLKHSNDPGLSSHVLNAIARMLPQGDTRFDRPSQTRQSSLQDRRVIDALSAGSMVHTAAVRAFETPAEPPKPKPWVSAGGRKKAA